jgi:tRNA uridine 5-carboxymethylaminomethyl modification enzyme
MELLNGLIHIGEKQFGGGRAGESAYMELPRFNSCRALNQVKTGTPPSVDGRSLVF